MIKGWVVRILLFVLAMVGVIRFETWYFTNTLEGVVLSVEGDQTLIAQNMNLTAEDFHKTYLDWVMGDYDVVEVSHLEGVTPGVHVRVDFDRREFPGHAMRVKAMAYEVLEMAFVVYPVEEHTVIAPVETGYNEGLAQLFPQEEGTFQVFTGYAEYGHVQKLVRVREEDQDLAIYFEGQMNDAKEDEENRKFNIVYRIEGDSVVEYIHNRDRLNPLGSEVLFHSIIPHKVILQGPLEKGTSWEQAFHFNGREHVAQTKIVRAELNKDGQMEYETLTVVENIDGYYEKRYEERRTFVMGRGMTAFSNRLSFEQAQTEEDSEDFYLFGFSIALERVLGTDEEMDLNEPTTE